MFTDDRSSQNQPQGQVVSHLLPLFVRPSSTSIFDHCLASPVAAHLSRICFWCCVIFCLRLARKLESGFFLLVGKGINSGFVTGAKSVADLFELFNSSSACCFFDDDEALLARSDFKAAAVVLCTSIILEPRTLEVAGSFATKSWLVFSSFLLFKSL